MSNKDAGNFLTGLAVGTVVGLAVGFLFAPKSGTETREILRQKAILAKQKADELAKKLKRSTAELKDKLQTDTE